MSAEEYLRREMVEVFREFAHKTLKSPWRTMGMCVAQYWDDEANDAVHSQLVYSTTQVIWPHHCPEEAWPPDPSDEPERGPTSCARCGGPERWLPRWHDNGADLIRAFAPFCREACNQEMELHEAYALYAVARRNEKGRIEIEVVGEPFRPWLLKDVARPTVPDELEDLLDLVFLNPTDDGPRQVLADVWLENNDPRGHFLVEQLAGGSGEAWLRGHSARWSGALARVTATPTTVFRRGFPAEVTAHFPSDAAVRTHGDHLAWSTVEVLRFGDESQIHLPRTATSLRVIENLPADQLDLLHRSAWKTQIERLDVVLRSDTRFVDVMGSVALRRLRLRNVSMVPEGVPWDQLEHLEVDFTVSFERRWMTLCENHDIGTLVMRVAGACVTITEGAVQLERIPQGWFRIDDVEQALQRISGHYPPADRPELTVSIETSSWTQRLQAAFDQGVVP